jgi:hypothetical protein
MLRVVIARAAARVEVTRRISVVGPTMPRMGADELEGLGRGIEVYLDAMGELLGQGVDVRLAILPTPLPKPQFRVAPLVDVPVHVIRGWRGNPHLLLDLFRRISSLWWPGAIGIVGPDASQVAASLRIATTLYLAGSTGRTEVAKEHYEVLRRSLPWGVGLRGRWSLSGTSSAKAGFGLDFGWSTYQQLRQSITFRDAFATLMRQWWGHQISGSEIVRTLDLGSLGEASAP